ncbi:MAG TPA: FAD-dependent oxidoreductase [Dehalococcoidia bacterium]|nr:FAD-dependent oxidoreductase [Dehalococcoidia bacterium]
MQWITEPERQTPVIADVDLLVCGGGFAGVAAAVCAARNGARTLLLERYGFLGGLVTGALVVTTPPLDNGINIEIAQRLRDRAVYAPCRYPGEEVAYLNLHAIDPEIVKYELVRMLRERGVELLLHTYIVESIVEEGGVKGVIVENKGGRQAILAKMVIDATGDADVAAFAKAPFRVAKKPMTMMFNMVGVDSERALAQIGNWSNLKKFVKQAIDRGELSFDLGIYMEFGAPGVHAENLIYPDELNIWSGNLLGMDGVDPQQLTQAELITREHAMRLADFLKKNIQGFENSRIEYTATQVGVRATRQIVGEASPSMEEVKTKKFEDTVVKPYAKGEMRLPYGSLLPQNVENLLVAGRCISAEEEAMGQLRLIPVCSATGQAAGVAAALALRQGVTPRQLDVSLLQRALSEQGMELGLQKVVR